MGMGRNGKSLTGIPWEWELVTKLGMGRNWNRLHVNGRELACKKPFPGISTMESSPSAITDELAQPHRLRRASNGELWDNLWLGIEAFSCARLFNIICYACSRNSLLYPQLSHKHVSTRGSIIDLYSAYSCVNPLILSAHAGSSLRVHMTLYSGY